MTPKEEQKHTDLLPCPFCGRNDHLRVAIQDTGNLLHPTTKMVRCTTCAFSGPWDVVEEKAITAWNTRKADCHEELDLYRKTMPALRDTFRMIAALFGDQPAENEAHWRKVSANTQQRCKHAMNHIADVLEQVEALNDTHATAKEAAPNDGEQPE